MVEKVNGNEPARRNNRASMKLVPVLPVRVEFYCECGERLPPPKTTLASDPPRYKHHCPKCEAVYILDHPSGLVAYQDVSKEADRPQLVIAKELPKQ